MQPQQQQQTDNNCEEKILKLQRRRAYYILLFTYLVLPSVSLKQFQALDCIIIADRSYLRIDTSISCDSTKFGTFAVFDACFIAIYMSLPLIWLVLLFNSRHRLNPPAYDSSLKQYIRDNDKSLGSLSFLFQPYRPEYYFFEVIEM
jgi:hypothetical protein